MFGVQEQDSYVWRPRKRMYIIRYNEWAYANVHLVSRERGGIFYATKLTKRA